MASKNQPSKSKSKQIETRQQEDENLTELYDQLYDQLLSELDRLDEIVLENHKESQYGEMDSSADYIDYDYLPPEPQVYFYT